MAGMLFGTSFDPELLRRAGERDEEYYRRLRGILDPARQIGGVSRDRVESALRYLGQGEGRHEVSVVLALLDDQLPNGFRPVQETYPFSAGARTAHIFCHSGILQLGESKIDREYQDYLINSPYART